MKNKTTYFCDNCNQEFEDYTECETHEAVCDDKHSKFKENVKFAVEKAKGQYGDIIDTITYKTDEEVDSYVIYSCMEYELYKFEIDCKLKNGNQVFIYDGYDEFLHLGNYLESNVIYNSLESAINNAIPTQYVGELNTGWDDGWREDMLGKVKLRLIVDRLQGRKVKIEVIE